MKAEEFASRAPDEVLNQPPALENYNIYESDRPLREAVAREGGGWVEAQAREFGALLGKKETLQLGELANRYPPVLHTHDRFGRRIDEVEVEVRVMPHQDRALAIVPAHRFADGREHEVECGALGLRVAERVVEDDSGDFQGLRIDLQAGRRNDVGARHFAGEQLALLVDIDRTHRDFE